MSYPLIYQIKSMLSMPNIYGNTFRGHIYNSFYNKLRLKVWTLIIRKHKYLGRFYSENVFENSEQIDIKDLYSDLQNYNKVFNKFGIVLLPNFLSDEDHLQFLQCYERKMSNTDSKIKYGQSVEVRQAIYEEIDSASQFIKDKAALISRNILGVNAPNRIKINLERLTIDESLEDIKDINTNFHSDRFCPTIKMFYYPKGVKQDHAQFEYIPGSHTINSKFIESYVNFYDKQASNQIERYPCALERYSISEPVKVVVPPNTMMVVATHGIHRRSNFLQGNLTSEHMERDAAQILFYSQQTKLNLILGKYLP